MPTIDGRFRAPTPAEQALVDALDGALERALDSDDALPDDPLWLACVALQAVIDTGWTPPTTPETDA